MHQDIMNIRYVEIFRYINELNFLDPEREDHMKYIPTWEAEALSVSNCYRLPAGEWDQRPKVPPLDLRKANANLVKGELGDTLAAGYRHLGLAGASTGDTRAVWKSHNFQQQVKKNWRPKQEQPQDVAKGSAPPVQNTIKKDEPQPKPDTASGSPPPLSVPPWKDGKNPWHEKLKQSGTATDQTYRPPDADSRRFVAQAMVAAMIKCFLGKDKEESDAL